MLKKFSLLCSLLFSIQLGSALASVEDIDPITHKDYSDTGLFGMLFSNPKPSFKFQTLRIIEYTGKHQPDTIIIDAPNKKLLYVEPNHLAREYDIGVGRPGFTWKGHYVVTQKREWPGWTPPKAMLLRIPELPKYMKGGLNNPLGARALYVGSTLYRIHGSNEPDTIGKAVSSGCIRLTNDDIIDLYKRAHVGTRIVVNE